MRFCFIMIWICLVAISLFTSSCRKDSNPESCLLKCADSLMQISPDSALPMLKSINYPGKLSRKERADYAILYSRVQDELQIRKTSDSLIREAVNYYAGGRNKEREMQAYYYWGCANKDMRKMRAAVNAFLKAVKVMPDKCGGLYLGAIYVKLAACYEDQDMYADALDMYRKACKVYREQHNEMELCYGYRGMAVIHHLQNQLDSSLLYYQKALSIAEKYDDKRWRYVVLSDLAHIYEKKKDFQKAYLCVSLSIAIAPSKDRLWAGYFLKGRILKHMNQVDSARYYFNIAKTSPYIYSHAGSCYELYDLERKQGNFSAAMAAVDSFLILSDSIQETTNALEIEKMVGRYEAKLMQQQLFLNNRIKLLSLGGLCVLIILVFLLKDRLSKNKIIKLQKQLNGLKAGILQNTSFDEDTNAALDSIKPENEDFETYFKMKLDLCLKLYKESDVYRKIHVIENDELRHKIHLNAAERQNICESLYENFCDLMADLKSQCTNLTKQDILYCIFLMMNCPKYVILLCTGISEGAFKTRKSRIKEKLGDKLFKLLINKEC